MRPDQISPADFSVVGSFLPTLTWSYPDPTCHPEGYRIDVALDNEFTNIVESGGTGSPATSWAPATPLQPGTEYWWRVAPINGTTLGPYSNRWRFYTGPMCDPAALAAPSLVWPANGEEIDTIMPLMEWENGNVGCIPQGYGIRLSPTADFSDTTYNGGTGNPSTRWFPGPDLMDCTVYYWYVFAGIDITFGPNSETRWFRTNASGTCAPVGTASISGKVFHDLCALIDGPMTELPPGCVDLGGTEGWAADGVYTPGEPGIPDVRVRLGVGPGPKPPILWDSVLTDAAGEYAFENLPVGEYTVYVDALEPDNVVVLIPGEWTLPRVSFVTASHTLTLAAGGSESDVLFGWDYQFLPSPSPAPAPAPAPFFLPKIEPDHMYYRGDNCGPMEAEFQVQVAEPEKVAGVWLFVRLKDKETLQVTSFSEALVMKPLGDGWYRYILQADAIPDFAKHRESWVQYQYVAFDKEFNPVEHSDVYWDLELSACGGITIPNEPQTYK
jgi:hypothetical protein